MIQETKLHPAIQAIQRLVVQGRTFAYEGKAGEEMALFLDHLEYLPCLILEPSDRTIFFGEYLKGICDEYHCIWIYDRFCE